VATGGAPLRPNIKGIDHQNVMFLRSGQNQADIKLRAATAKNIVVIGTGFIGSESASALKMHLKDGATVHIVGSSNVPLEKQLGKEIGETIKA
jgi:NAD(P)H-nitrite reductase large subunit